MVWFQHGYKRILKTRENLLIALNSLGFECRPIVAGNFVKNKVIKYFNAEIDDEYSNASLIDTHGLFIGNHHLDERSNKLNKTINFNYE